MQVRSEVANKRLLADKTCSFHGEIANPDVPSRDESTQHR